MRPDFKQEQQRRRALLFSVPLDERGIEVLEQRFECHLPCFQGRCGGYDPLDAMRRDAHREVMLYLRDQLAAYRNETKDSE